MNSYASSLPYVRPDRPGLALVLTVAVHLAAAALLLWGMRWQVPPTPAVQLELWSQGSVQAERRAPAPRREARRPAPPTAEPIAEPIAEPSPQPRPQPPADTSPQREPAAAEIERPVATERPKPEPREKTRPQAARPAARPATPAPEPRYIPQPDVEEELASLRAGSASGKQSVTQSGRDSGPLLEQYRQELVRTLREDIIIAEPAGNPVAVLRLHILASMVIKEHVWISRSGDAAWDAAVERSLALNRQLPPLPAGLSYTPELRQMKVVLCPKTCRDN